MATISNPSEVLTLDEVAEYLRLPREVVERQANRGALPGRKIEDDWRFLKTAINGWLSHPDSRLQLLQQAGAFRDDETMEALRAAIYAERGRPEVDAAVESRERPPRRAKKSTKSS